MGKTTMAGRSGSSPGSIIRTFYRLLGHATTLLLLALLTYRLGVNLLFLHKTRERAANMHAPRARVSILVPARNEAATITACVTSLLDQDYADFEVIVLNDASTDSTAAQLDALAAQDSRLRVIHAEDTLPTGWNGKSYACHRLAQYATGDWLLFSDADTQHTPQSIARGLAYAHTLGAALVSAFPHQVTESWSERILVSFIVDFLPLIGLDLRAISQGRGNHSAGNGQYLLTSSAAYHQVGGHAAVAYATLDDFTLIRRYRQAGHRVAFVDGRAMLSCRMYRSASAVWEGFSRSLMHGLDNSTTTRHSWPWMLFFAWCFGCLFVNPFVHAWRTAGGTLALLEITWLFALRALVNGYLQRSWFETLTTPLAAWGVMALGLSALRRRWQGQTVAWKGRNYVG